MAKKDSPWFTHDSNAASDPKIIALLTEKDMAGYGRWWRLVEVLRNEAGYRYDVSQKFAYPSLANFLKFPTADEAKEFVRALIHDFELLNTDGEYIWSDSLLRRMQPWDAKKESYSARGKKGAEATNAKKAAKADTPPPNPREGDLLKQYKEMEKGKLAVYNFIKDQKPAFIEPYVDYWNIFASEKKLPLVKIITDPRKRKFNIRVKEEGFNFTQILFKAAKSEFLLTGNWFTFDWIITSANNYTKVLEGNYDNKEAGEKTEEASGVDKKLEKLLNK